MKKKGFTLIELIAVLVILAILALIVTPLVMNIIRKAKISADKRSIDAYGRSVELAIATHLLDTGTFPTDLKSLTIEYTGKEVSCNVMQMKENGGIYLSECRVAGKQVKDDTEDGYYHYGTRDLTNEEYVDMYGLSLKNASIAYYEANGNSVEDYSTLTIDYKGKPVACEVTVNYDGTIYMTKCKVNNVDVTDDTEDGYYHYGADKSTAVKALLLKTNPSNIINYEEGNKNEMYTFTHPATIQQAYDVNDYRYIGNNPNNYVRFNNVLWRIIGVFTVEDENGNQERRMKIVENNVLYKTMQWNSNGNNDWNSATLKDYLNIDYYNTLSDVSKSMIGSSKYYLGGIDNSYKNAEYFYNAERSNRIYGNISTIWIGKIALMYPSDFIYSYTVNSTDNCPYNDPSGSDGIECKSKSWIYDRNKYCAKSEGVLICDEWLLNSYTFGNKYIYHVWGGSDSMHYATNRFFVRPATYLKSQVKITAGDGSEDNPYQLSL